MNELFFASEDFALIYQRLKKSESSDAIYQEIISIGKSSPLKIQWDFQDSDKVDGCQSLLYVRAKLDSGKLYFEFYSDALISQGLAALLVGYYTGMSPKEFLTNPPIFLKQLNLGHLLSMGRSNGVNSLYKKMLGLVLSICKEP